MPTAAGSLGTLYAELRLMLDKFNADVAEARLKMQGFSDDAVSDIGRISKVGGSLQKVGTAMTLGLTVPIVGIGAAAVKTGMEFDAAMSLVRAVSDVTGEEFGQLRDLAIEMGKETKFSALESAEAMGELGKLGFDAAEQMSALPATLALAAAGSTELNVAAEIVAKTMNAFGESADQTTRYADVFAKAAAIGALDVTTMGEALSYAAPAAAAMGYTLEDTTAILAVFADAGQDSTRAGTLMEAMMRDLKASAIETGGTLDVLSASGELVKVAMYDAAGETRPFVDILADLEVATEGMSDAQRDAALSQIANTKSLRGLNILLGKGSEYLSNYTDAIYDSEGAGQTMADTMMNNLAGAVEEFRGSVETAAIVLSDQLTPFIREATEWLKKFFDWFIELDDGTKKAIVGVLLFIAALGPLFVMFGTFLKLVAPVITLVNGVGTALAAIVPTIGAVVAAFQAGGLGAGLAAISAALGPIGWVVLALAALAAVAVVVWQNWDKVKAAFEVVAQWMAPVIAMFKQTIETLGGQMGPVVEQLRSAWDALKDAVEPLMPVFEFLGKFIGGVLVVALGILIGVVNGVLSALAPLAKVFAGLVEVIANVVKMVVGLVQGLLTGDWSMVAEAWEGIKTGIVNIFSGLWEAVLAVLGGFWTGIVTFFTSLVPELTNSIGLFFTVTVPQWFADMWTTVTTWVSTGITNVVTWFQTLPERVGAFLNDLFTVQIPYLIGFGIGWMIRTIADGIVAVVTFFMELPAKIAEWLTVAITNITTWAKNAYDTLVTWVGNAIDDVVTFFMNLPGRVWTWLQETIGKIAAWVSELPGKAEEAGTSLVDGFMNFVEELPGKMVGIGTDVASKISEWGTDLFNKAKSVASSIWEGFKDGLGIHSPSYIEEAMDRILSESAGMLGDMKGIFGQMGDLSVQPNIGLAGAAFGPGGTSGGMTTSSVVGDTFHIVLDASKMPSADFEGLLASLQMAKQMVGST